jgi:hypothetical protein
VLRKTIFSETGTSVNKGSELVRKKLEIHQLLLILMKCKGTFEASSFSYKTSAQ